MIFAGLFFAMKYADLYETDNNGIITFDLQDSYTPYAVPLFFYMRNMIACYIKKIFIPQFSLYLTATAGFFLIKCSAKIQSGIYL